MGRITKLNQKANRILKKLFMDKGVTYCEVCGSNSMLSWAHKKKRRAYYSQPEKLSDFNEVLLLCVPCHQAIEYDREKSELLFNRLRGKE